MSGKALLQQYQQRVEALLETEINTTSHAEKVRAAMQYSLLNGGKRVRPVLVYMANQLLQGDLSNADAAASAIECIHSYSLVHDDLPAMDDDDLRRGKPTCHIQFDEATAILAGDGLQALAFDLLSRPTTIAPAIQLQMIQSLARNSSHQGMVGGQSIDLSNEGKRIPVETLELMHRHKTGALINCSIEMGALSSEQASTEDLTRLAHYSDAIGLAFQVKDDILDIEADTETLGKPQGSDLALEKSTYPSLLGLDGAKHKLAQLNQQAQDNLASFGDRAEPLRWLANYIVERQY
ncbi:MAG: (2E,6E)-farnesyl diphosphate synthase [Amphritea sp.]|nr:(2E,6E)-farnesyl diphosphate synthase [Amphritea sp.]